MKARKRTGGSPASGMSGRVFERMARHVTNPSDNRASVRWPTAGNGALCSLAALALAGCISFGAEPPETLLTLTPTTGSAASVPVAATIDAQQRIAVLTPEVPAMLDVTRVPVRVSETKLAYLQDAFWVEKPARLFRRLLAERLRQQQGPAGQVLVLDNDDVTQLATQYVRGSLLDLTYDADRATVIARFDAMRTGADGVVVTRRFEASEAGIAPDAEAVGPALNRVANELAGDVADWVLATP